MSEEISGNGLDVTLREFASDQKVFNRYRLIKTLGRGGMGVVWLARDEELERDVALKFLPDLIIRDRAVLGDLKRETRRSLELTHKNIVRIYDFVHDQTSGCISMEYVDGDTLSNLRADKPHKVFESDELKDWVSELCDALDYAHNDARIVHRDLKPANLMVNKRNDLKVADFGIARSLSDSVSKVTMEHGRSGTLVYMSPQQLEGERGSHLDDVYSLGASLYELLTSKPPFYSGNVDRQIREKIPPTMSQRRKELEIEGEPIDEAWEEVVRACLAKNPDRRPQSVSEVAKMLSVPSPTTRRAKRAAGTEGSFKTWAGALATVAAVLILGVGAWFAFQAMQKSSRERSTHLREGYGRQASAPVQTAPVAPERSAPKSTPPAPETSSIPAKPNLIANGIYTGMIRVKFDNSGRYTPLTIVPASDRRSGTMTQSSHRGDMVVKYTGIWDGPILRAVTDEVVSKPDGVAWEPEAFTLQFSDDGKNATYECNADGKIYLADLKAQSVDSSVEAKLSSIYKGAITGGTPLTINFGGDRKSGTMTQTAKSGDVVVKFTGIWDGATLRAVTNEVISKPAQVRWDPESFTLHFSEDGRVGSYECSADGKYYTAHLSPP